MSRRLRRSKTRASMGDCADRGAGLSKVGLRARSAPVAAPATLTARKIANGDKRIWIAELVYRSNPWVGEKFRFCEWGVSGNGTRFVWYGVVRSQRATPSGVLGSRERGRFARAARIR